MEIATKEGYSPVTSVASVDPGIGCVWLPRVVQFESAVLIRRCTSPKAKYCTKSDSEQVV